MMIMMMVKKFGMLHDRARQPYAGAHADLLCIVPISIRVQCTSYEIPVRLIHRFPMLINRPCALDFLHGCCKFAY